MKHQSSKRSLHKCHPARVRCSVDTPTPPNVLADINSPEKVQLRLRKKIELQAYELWLNRQGPNDRGNADSDWLTAERLVPKIEELARMTWRIKVEEAAREALAAVTKQDPDSIVPTTPLPEDACDRHLMCKLIMALLDLDNAEILDSYVDNYCELVEEMGRYFTWIEYFV